MLGKIVLQGRFGILIGAPILMNIVGYARDSVRMFDTSQYQTAFVFYKTNNADSEYPDGFKTLVDAKVLQKEPKDPSEALDFKKIETVFKVFGMESFLGSKDVTKENGYYYDYLRSKDKINFKVSTKLESVFFKRKMQEDNGIDSDRYELGTDLTIKSDSKSSTENQKASTKDNSGGQEDESIKEFMKTINN